MQTASMAADNPFRPAGEVARLANNIADNWLIGLRETNPAILDMFHERDRKPYRDLLPWSGEFAGKYLTGAYMLYRLTGHKPLKAYIAGFLEEFLTCIDEDGYLGCFQKDCRLTGAFSQTPHIGQSNWDAWAHYHAMMGLYLWHKELHDERLWQALLQIADLFLRTFYTEEGKRLSDLGFPVTNMAPIHIFALLYQDTGDSRYLTFAKQVQQDMEMPDACPFTALYKGGKEFYQCPQPRWESLHNVMGIAALYACTGEELCRQTAEHIFYSILKTDVHNTGAFSTEEQAVGQPFTNGKIELCCVIAYNVLACDILRLNGDSHIADFLEISLYNAVMGSFSPTGRWSTYDTPMEGTRCANYHSIGFQCRPGSPELNCCSVNAARGIGTLADWAVMEEKDTVYIQYLGACSFTTASGLSVSISGDYPASPHIDITLHSSRPVRVALRIPAWSHQTELSLGGEVHHPEAGQYWYGDKLWEDTIHLTLDFTPHLLAGGGDYAEKYSLYIGPVLYGYDLSFSDNLDFDALPAITQNDLEQAVPLRREDKGDIILPLPNGMTLRNFYRLGDTGSIYKTWFTCLL